MSQLFHTMKPVTLTVHELSHTADTDENTKHEELSFYSLVSAIPCNKFHNFVSGQ